MATLQYDALAKEIADKLEAEQMLVLATCADNKVTARMMCHVSDGLNILFSTSRQSEKVDQMKANPNIALAIGNIKVEAVAELFGHPEGHPTFLAAYHAKFPDLAALYASTEDDLLVIARPTEIALYKYIDGPCEDVLNVSGQTAMRTGLS